MNRPRTLVLTLIVALLAGVLVALFATSIAPVADDGALDVPVVAAFVGALTVLVGALATLLALALHARWPALAGAHRGRPNPVAAVRQGALAGVVCLTFLVLALLDSLDIAFVLVTLLLAGLVEAFVQVRG